MVPPVASRHVDTETAASNLLPRMALVVLMLSMTMVPIWIGLHIGANFPVQCLIALMAIAVTIGGVHLTLTRIDIYFAGFLAISLVAVWLGGSSQALWVQFPIRWAIPYMAARVLVAATSIRFVTNLIAVLFGLVGVLAVVELAFGWHPFVGWAWDSPEYQIWGSIQERAGRDRSEWAFGHSIALGASLAMSIPFILNSSYKSLAKTALLLTVLAGVFASGSRGALLSVALTAFICFLYRLKEPSARIATLVLVTLGGLIAAPTLTPIVQLYALDTNEQQESAEYRRYLYSNFIRAIDWFGESSLAHLAKESTDSAILHIGLRFGWIVLIMVLLPLMAITLRVVRGIASSAELSVVGQIPVFATVALITQYQLLIFFVVGIAVHVSVSSRVKITHHSVCN